jgi:hypothetical protein
VVAIDRHQRARKVESTAFPDEANRYDEELGLPSGPAGRLAAKALKAGIRAAGAAPLARLPSRVEPALDLEFPSLSARMRAQLLRTRAQMSFGSD